MRRTLAGSLWLFLLLVGCASCPEERPSQGERDGLRSLSHVLRHSGTVQLVSNLDRDRLVSMEGWTEADFEELRLVLNQAYTGQEVWEMTGVDGLTQTAGAEGETELRAVIARERNGLLADLVDRGELGRLLKFLRTHRVQPPVIQYPWQEAE